MYQFCAESDAVLARRSGHVGQFRREIFVGCNTIFGAACSALPSGISLSNLKRCVLPSSRSADVESFGAVPVAEIIEIPALAYGATASHYVLIDQNFDGAKATGEIPCNCIGLGDLQRSDLRIMLSGDWHRCAA